MPMSDFKVNLKFAIFGIKEEVSLLSVDETRLFKF